MSFIEEHFDTEVTIVGGIISAIWGLVRLIDSKDKAHLRESLERIENNVNQIRKELKEITENLVCPEQITKLDDEISEMQKEFNLMREKSVSAERMAKMDEEFQGLRSMIQKTREEAIRIAERERRAAESIDRIEKKVDSKVDDKACNLLMGGRK